MAPRSVFLWILLFLSTWRNTKCVHYIQRVFALLWYQIPEHNHKRWLQIFQQHKTDRLIMRFQYKIVSEMKYTKNQLMDKNVIYVLLIAAAIFLSLIFSVTTLIFQTMFWLSAHSFSALTQNCVSSFSLISFYYQQFFWLCRFLSSSTQITFHYIFLIVSKSFFHEF